MILTNHSATFVEARNVFHRDGRGANVGTYAFGFLWAAWACLFISTILFCAGIKTGTDRGKKNGYVANGDKTAGIGGRKGWRRRRNSRSGSHNGRRVKDEYS